MHCTCYVDTLYEYEWLRLNCIRTYIIYYIFFFRSMVQEKRKKMGTFEKLIQLFRLTRVVSQFNHTHTKAFTSIHIHWLVYMRTRERVSEHIRHTLVTKLGKQIIIFVLYACIVVKTHTHNIIYYTIRKETQETRNHSNVVVSFLGAHTQ